jgi:hypothetical protein
MMAHKEINMNEIATRETIEDMVANRDATINAYFAAFEPIKIAEDALNVARKLWIKACNDDIRCSGSSSTDEVKEFEQAVRLPDPDRWRRTVVRLVDISCWNNMIQRTKLHAMMDREERTKFEQSLQWVPERHKFIRDNHSELVNLDAIQGIPPFTVDNVYATIERLAGDSGMIFRRGIANAFSKLDRRFRSHDGFKIGNRLILSYGFSTYSGQFDAYGDTAKTIRDIERTFLVLDEQDVREDYAGIIGLMNNERKNCYNPHQSEHEHEFFKIRVFKNGNAHLWFTRPDLLSKVNKLLAEYYGEVIGDNMTDGAPDDPFENRKMTPAQAFGFFPTPDEAAKKLMEKARLYTGSDQSALRVLEPSAGTGNLVKRCVTPSVLEDWMHRSNLRQNTIVDCVEIQPHMARDLEDMKGVNRVWCRDFITMSPDETGLYDRIVMNPPFDLERDIDHVTHAWTFLKTGGILVAIMSAGTEFRETKKTIAFRQLIERNGGEIRDLPAGSFSSVGTYLNTVTVSITKKDH